MSKQKIREWLKKNYPDMVRRNENVEFVSGIIHQYTKDQSGWVSVDGYEELPKGNWLVLMEGSSIPMTAEVGNYCLIGNCFAWDRNKVIAYKPLPPTEEA